MDLYRNHREDEELAGVLRARAAALHDRYVREPAELPRAAIAFEKLSSASMKPSGTRRAPLPHFAPRSSSNVRAGGTRRQARRRMSGQNRRSARERKSRPALPRMRRRHQKHGGARTRTPDDARDTLRSPVAGEKSVSVPQDERRTRTVDQTAVGGAATGRSAPSP